MQDHQGFEILIFIVALAVYVAVKGGIGYLIGRNKGRGSLGFILGLFLGCIGWIIIALLPAENVAPPRPMKLCRECRRQIPKTSRACPHCGGAQGIAQRGPGKPADPETGKPKSELRRPPLR